MVWGKFGLRMLGLGIIVDGSGLRRQLKASTQVPIQEKYSKLPCWH